jgi:hypothetical protein
MSDDFSNPGTESPNRPDSGPIYEWGNTQSWMPVIDIPLIGEYDTWWINAGGPTGPVSKNCMYKEDIEDQD